MAKRLAAQQLAGNVSCSTTRGMLRAWRYGEKSSRDLRIDWLRGLAMTCVIVDHSKLSSLLSWFSYERFWTVTAAEVFVVLSGAVLGMVYGRKLNQGHWTTVVRDSAGAP